MLGHPVQAKHVHASRLSGDSPVAAQAPPSLSGKAQRVHGGRQWRASQVLLHFEAGVTTLSFAWWPP